MEIMSFRHPQFSEDAAWLPIWLQQCQGGPLHELEKESSSLQSMKKFAFEENDIEGKDADLPSTGEGRYNSFHLFLSGEDNASVSLVSSSEQAMQFHLHLSSADTIPSLPNLLVDTSQQERLELHNILSMKQIVTSALPVPKANQSNIDCDSNALKLPHIESSNVLLIRQVESSDVSIEHNKSNLQFGGPNFNSSYPKDDEVDNAVELFIAASEALVIHDLVESGLHLEPLSAAAVLEVSLRLKKARSEMFCLSLDEDSDENEIDSLIDLDEITMADAFADVGLLINDNEYVKETPASGNPSGFDDTIHCKECMVYEKFFVDNSAQMQTGNDLAADKIFVNNLTSKNLLSYLPSLPLPSQKELEDSAHKNMNNAKSYPKIFGDGTSFLSESAYIASDQNSFVQKNESSFRKTSSQSSIPFKGLYGLDQATEGVSTSQAILRSSNFSATDPLCSVVPCSISSQTDTSANDRHFNENHIHISPENPSRSIPVKFVNEKVENLPIINMKDSCITFRRRTTSLKSYSMIKPYCDAFLGRDTVNRDESCSMECNLKRQPSEKTLDNVVFSSEKDETTVQPCSLSSKCNRDNYSQNHETSFSGDPNTEIANEKEKGVKSPKYSSALETLIEYQNGTKRSVRLSKSEDHFNVDVPKRKKVRFSEATVQLQRNNQLHKPQPLNKNRSTWRASKRLKPSNPSQSSQGVKMRLTNFRNINNNTRQIFQGMEFLLTGLSSRKEKDIEGLVRKYGGSVLSDIPSVPSCSKRKKNTKSDDEQIPVVLASKKLKTTKFLYGCAVHAFILRTTWLMDSIAACSVLPPDKYTILSNRNDGECTTIGTPVLRTSQGRIFEKVGIMLDGKHSFCTKLAEIFKHGGGYVSKTLQWLVHSIDNGKIYAGLIIAEDKFRVSRHLKHCASEQKIPIMSASWIINSLYLGRLLPLPDIQFPTSSMVKVADIQISMELSVEI